MVAVALWVWVGVQESPQEISAALPVRYLFKYPCPIKFSVNDKLSTSRCCCCGVPSAVVSTLAGSTTPGNADGVGASAKFSGPSGMSMDSSGNVIVADLYNNMIRKISPTGIAA